MGYVQQTYAGVHDKHHRVSGPGKVAAAAQVSLGLRRTGGRLQRQHMGCPAALHTVRFVQRAQRRHDRHCLERRSAYATHH